LLLAGAGTLHFLKTDTFIKIVPPLLPAPRLLVYASGVAEIAGAVGLLVPGIRRMAAWGLVLLLVAVFGETSPAKFIRLTPRYRT
jgi:uncharacterized membrane protein